jgi:hypothetical protein
MLPRTRDRRPPHDLSHLSPEAARPELRHARRLACCSGSWRGGTKQLRYYRVHVLATDAGETLVLWRFVSLYDGESGKVRSATYATREEARRALESFDGLAGVPPAVTATYTDLVGEVLHALRAPAKAEAAEASTDPSTDHAQPEESPDARRPDLAP